MGDRLLDFTGQSVMITGASTGIGRAVALAFARQGGKIAIGDADPRAQETVDPIVAQVGTAFYQPTDVRKGAEVAALVDATEAVRRFELCLQQRGHPAGDATSRRHAR